MDPKRSYKRLHDRAITSHARIPILKRLPFPAIAIILALVLANCLVWMGVGIVLVRPLLQSLQDQFSLPLASASSNN